LQVEQYFSLVKLPSIGISFGLYASLKISSMGFALNGPFANGGNCLGINPGFVKEVDTKKYKDRDRNNKHNKNAAGLLYFCIKYTLGKAINKTPGINIRKNVTNARFPSGLHRYYPVIIRPSR
jgi:hypothetical protein